MLTTRCYCNHELVGRCGLENITQSSCRTLSLDFGEREAVCYSPPKNAIK